MAFGLPLAALLLGALCVSCIRPQQTAEPTDYVLLAPDWKNGVVHVISLDGAYEGDFLDSRRFDPAGGVDPRAWEKPRGLVWLDDPPRLWLTSERALSQWDASGRFERVLFSDSQKLEDPSAIRRVGEEVFVLSEDKKAMLVFDLQGTLTRTFGFPHLGRAKDFVVGPHALLYACGSLLHTEIPGLVSVWDPQHAGPQTPPIRHHVPADVGEDGTFWLHGLAFDDDGKLLVTEFSRGRVERWDLTRNEKVEVLLDGDQPGAYTELERGPDGLVYLASPRGIYRFHPRAQAAELEHLTPFFDAETLAARYPRPFSPGALTFVPRSALVSHEAAR